MTVQSSQIVSSPGEGLKVATGSREMISGSGPVVATGKELNGPCSCSNDSILLDDVPS
jgi:hypothetical protein